jgi:hypothetical protein
MLVAAGLQITNPPNSWFAACSGATIGDDDLALSEDQTFLAGDPKKSILTGVNSKSGVSLEPSQLNVLSRATQEITMSIGGNDSGFATVANDCLQLQNLFSINSKVHQTVVMTDLGNILSHSGFFPDFETCTNALSNANWVIAGGATAPLTLALMNVYRAVLDSAPNARLSVMNYPQLLTTNLLPKTGFCQLTGASPTFKINIVGGLFVGDSVHLGFSSSTQAAIVSAQARANGDIAMAISLISKEPAYSHRISLIDVNTTSKSKALSCQDATLYQADVNAIKLAPLAGITGLYSPYTWVAMEIANIFECSLKVAKACAQVTANKTKVYWLDPSRFISSATLHPTAAFHAFEGNQVLSQFQRRLF